MAPIKFEEHIKDKLEKRTVAPSADTWSKLSQQLDAEDNSSKKSTFWWIGIAASIAALIMISVGYFNRDSESKINEIIVKDNIEEVIAPKSKNTLTTTHKSNPEKQEIVIEQDHTEERQIEKKKKESLAPQQKGLIEKNALNKSNTTVAKAENQKLLKNEKSELDDLSNIPTTKNSEIEFKSVVAELRIIKSNQKNTVTDQQIDSLLKIASRELLIDKAIKKKGNIVDADALLQDVEDAMGQSFRTRIYETLKTGFKGVKKAVVKRND